MTKIVLVRHAFAGDIDPKLYPDDLKRPLTPRKGIKKFSKAAVGLGNLIKPDVVFASPAVRCIQTAILIERKGGWPLAKTSVDLGEDATTKDVINMLQDLPDLPSTVALVGHGPNLAELMAYLVLGADTDNELNKGGAALITINKKMKPGTGKLVWQMDQKQLKRHR